MSNETLKVLGLVAQVVDGLTQVVDHSQWCSHSRGKCDCGLLETEATMRLLWDEVERLESKHKLRALEEEQAQLELGRLP